MSEFDGVQKPNPQTAITLGAMYTPGNETGTGLIADWKTMTKDRSDRGFLSGSVSDGLGRQTSLFTGSIDTGGGGGEPRLAPRETGETVEAGASHGAPCRLGLRGRPFSASGRRQVVWVVGVRSAKVVFLASCFCCLLFLGVKGTGHHKHVVFRFPLRFTVRLGKKQHIILLCQVGSYTPLDKAGQSKSIRRWTFHLDLNCTI